MAGVRPGFITGASARIKLFGKTFAYATDVSYNISVEMLPIETIGKYEVHSNEPIGYRVGGSFSIIRYSKFASTAGIQDVADNKGNAPADVDAGMKAQLDPSKLLTSQTFDMEIFQRLTAGRFENAAGAADQQSILKLQDCRITSRSGSLNRRGVLVENYAFVGTLGHDMDVDNNGGLVGNSGAEDLK